MTMEEMERFVNEAVETGDDGKMRLPCAKAFAIHRANGISLADIGEICDRNGIKISQCQLKCFR